MNKLLEPTFCCITVAILQLLINWQQPREVMYKVETVGSFYSSKWRVRFMQPRQLAGISTHITAPCKKSSKWHGALIFIEAMALPSESRLMRRSDCINTYEPYSRYANGLAIIIHVHCQLMFSKDYNRKILKMNVRITDFGWWGTGQSAEICVSTYILL